MTFPATSPTRATDPQRRHLPRPVAVALGPRLPARRDINFILNVALPWLLILSFVSGWMASWLGLTEFGLHKYSSIAVFVIALAHLALHWRSLATHLRRLVGARRPAPARYALRLLEHDNNNADNELDVAAVAVRPTGT
jgi:hypothetical protein